MAFGILGIVAGARGDGPPAIARPARPGVDHAGRPIVADRAPALRFERRTAPRPYGIDYPFKVQTARGVANFARFPEFALRDRRIHVSGPWYDSDAANLHFSRGITSVEAMPNFRQGPSDIRRQPPERKTLLLMDPFWYGYARRLADDLAKKDPADPRIDPLRRLGEGRHLILHEAAYVALGRYAWERELGQLDAGGRGALYPCIDMETMATGWEHQRQCVGWLYQGIAQAAANHGLKVVPITYGQWTFSVGTVHESMRWGGKGAPEYLRPEKDFLAAPDPTLKAINDNHGVVSMDGYLQAVWGDEPFYKRKPDGSLVLIDGKPVFNDLKTTRAYGQEMPLEPGEAERALQDLYRQATRLYLMYHRLAGEYPSSSGLRKDFLNNVRIGAWSRITNEGVQGIKLNDRPLPPWQIETLIGLYLMTADDVFIWSSDTNHPPGPLGGDYSKWWKYNAHGVVEHIVKAAHRYSALDPLHDGYFRWCWFRLPMVNKNRTDGDRYEQKPLVIGKLRTYQGRPWIELYATWPALDARPAELKLWVEKDGRRSGAYTVRLRNGRSYFYDAWELPAEFADLEGRDVYLRFTDQLGTVRTWRGDWRVEADPATPTPPDFSPRG